MLLLLRHLTALFGAFSIHMMGYQTTFAIASVAAALRMGPLLLLTGLVKVGGAGRVSTWATGFPRSF